MPDMLVRLKKGKTTFEVLTRDGAVTKYREGAIRNLDDVVVSEEVWTNISKGQKASKEQLMNAFETDDNKTVLEQIVTRGEHQLSAGERKDMLDKKRAEIVAYINKNYVDSAKGTPLPITRIENALEQVKPRIDLDQPAEKQVSGMFDKLIKVLPLRKGNSVISGVVKVPHAHAGATSGVVRKHATVVKEDYGADGAKWTVEVHSYDALMRDLARVTKGDYDFSVDGPSSSAAEAESSQTKKGGRKGKKGKR